MTHPALCAEPDEIETIVDVVKQLAHHRQTHIQWAERLENTPPDEHPKYIGSAEFHRKIESKYTKMIQVLESTVEDKHGRHD